MNNGSPSLLVISLAVGAFGALTGRLFTWLLIPKFGFDFGLPPFAFAWISPAVLFASASMAFAFAYGVFPATRGRARRAGWVSAVMAYLCHSAWIAVYSGAVYGQSMITIFLILVLMFVVIGWLPILSGLFAGWCVEQWQRTPRVETEVDRRGRPIAASLDFGLVGALLSVPLVFALFMIARRSRVDFAFFFPSAPFLLFGLAALVFWLCNSMLAATGTRIVLSMTLRGRIAGVLAALVTYFSFLFWTRYAINLGVPARNVIPYGASNNPFLAVFLLTGWLPVVFGGLVGGWAVRRQAVSGRGA